LGIGHAFDKGKFEIEAFSPAIMGTGTYFLRRYGGMVESDIAVSLSRHIIRTLGKREWNVAGLHIAIVHGTNARRLQK
jgi:hypothetical protein